MSRHAAAASGITAVHRRICTIRRERLEAFPGPGKIRAMKNRSRGVTLIELVTAIAVLGILTAIAVPGFRQFTANSRTVATTNDLVTALNVARSEALRRSSNAVVCTSTNGTSCSASTDWVNGWIVFADRNANGSVDADELVQSWQAVGNNFTVSATTVAGGTAVDRVTYNNMGMGQLPAGVSRIRFQVVSPVCSGVTAGRTEVGVTGMIQSSKVACP